MTTAIGLALSKNVAIVILVTVVVTALSCTGIFLLWSRFHEDADVVGRERRRTLTPTFVLLILSIVMNGVGLLGISVVTSDTNRVVGYVREQTSPEAQKRQENLLNGVLVTIDCNGASRLQKGFDALSEQGLIGPIDVTQNCAHTSIQTPGDEPTTTTVP